MVWLLVAWVGLDGVVAPRSSHTHHQQIGANGSVLTYGSTVQYKTLHLRYTYGRFVREFMYWNHGSTSTENKNPGRH